jgi:hypothetical protein
MAQREPVYTTCDVCGKKIKRVHLEAHKNLWHPVVEGATKGNPPQHFKIVSSTPLADNYIMVNDVKYVPEGQVETDEIKELRQRSEVMQSWLYSMPDLLRKGLNQIAIKEDAKLNRIQELSKENAELTLKVLQHKERADNAETEMILKRTQLKTLLGRILQETDIPASALAEIKKLFSI